MCIFVRCEKYLVIIMKKVMLYEIRYRVEKARRKVELAEAICRVPP
jgi:hypothetical protein